MYFQFLLILVLFVTNDALKISLNHLNHKDIKKHIITSIIVFASTIVNIVPLPSINNAYADDTIEVIKGITEVDGDIASIYRKGRQNEGILDYEAAQKFYEEVVVAEPLFIPAWADLGNVLIARGDLKEGLLCYKKALSLRPPKKLLSTIILNKASVEMSLGLTDDAINDLSIAEKISNNDPAILTNKAVALSNTGNWAEACNIFEKVITTADRNALPWWLRYAMSLLEVNRSIEGVAFLQRTINRFPEEAECKAFACALYTSLGQLPEAGRYWKQMLPADRELYSQKNFVKEKLLWGPKAYTSFDEFLLSKYSKLD